MRETAQAHVEEVADFLQRARAAVVEAVARAQDAALARAQRVQHVVHVAVQVQPHLRTGTTSVSALEQRLVLHSSAQ